MILTIKKSHPGHFVTMGSNAGSLKNPHWLIQDENDDEYYIMYCEKDGFTKFSKEDYSDIITRALMYLGIAVNDGSIAGTEAMMDSNQVNDERK